MKRHSQNYRNLILAMALSVPLACAQTSLLLQTPQDAMKAAADALGGRDRILALKTIVIEGGGINPNVGQIGRAHV